MAVISSKFSDLINTPSLISNHNDVAVLLLKLSLLFLLLLLLITLLLLLRSAMLIVLIFSHSLKKPAIKKAMISLFLAEEKRVSIPSLSIRKPARLVMTVINDLGKECLEVNEATI